MSGNTWEWTDSWYSDNYNTERVQEHKVIRGGSWGSSVIFTRSAYRGYVSPDDRYNSIGFRLLRTN